MINDVICNECQNRDICKYREEYEQVYAAVADTKIHKTLDDGRHSVCDVQNISYVTIAVGCKHFRRDTVSKGMVDIEVEENDGEIL